MMTINRSKMMLITRGHPLIRNNSSKRPVRKVVNRLGMHQVNGGLRAAIAEAAMLL